MEFMSLCMTSNDLLQVINRHYGLQGEKIHLHRTSGGRVYYINCRDGRKVFKLYRPMHTECALQTTHIIPYLEGCGFPIVHILPTISGDLYINVDMAEGQCIGILFEFAKGKCIGFLHRWRDNKQPLIHPKARMFGRQVGLMHRLMDHYGGGLIPKGRERYIEDFIGLLRRDGYDEGKTHDLEQYGNELWAMVDHLPAGFCHGDMHTGNTLYRGGQFIWMDFDRASISRPVIDVGWLTDGSDFNVFDEMALDRSLYLFDELYAGYSIERVLTQAEIRAAFECIAIIHYDLISSIVIMNGETLNKSFLDEQHDWLMRWRELCAKRL